MNSAALDLPPTMTVAEFLSHDDGTDVRHELIDGRIVAMAPPSPQHSTIAGNIAAALQPRLRRPCRIQIEYGITLPDDDRSYYQADLAVVCGAIERGAPAPEPIAVIEVVSPSSYDHDLGRKRSAYMRLEACRLMLFVESERRHVELWLREADRWVVQSHIGATGTIRLDPLATTLELETIYEAVDIP